MAILATDRDLERAKAIDGKPTDYAIKGASGLRLRVMASGYKTWSLIYRGHDGKKGRTRLGEYPDMDRKKAITTAQRLNADVGEGRNPAQEKRDAKRPMDLPKTIDELASDFLEKHAKVKTLEITWKETERMLRRDVLPVWKGRRLDTIKQGHVVALLDDIDSRHKVHAYHVLAVIRKMFNWAVGKGIMESSPCAQVKSPAKVGERDRVLTDDELRLLWVAAGKLNPPFNAYVKLLTLTAQRRGEVAGMRWTEVDLAKKEWLLPAIRAKTKQENLVPLAPTAMAILEALPRHGDSDLVFTTNGTAPISGFAKLKNQLDKLMAEENGAPIAAWELQRDLRRTGSTTMNRLGALDFVVDRVLNHKITGIQRRYNRYSYSQEKKAALEAWAAFLDRLVNGDNVVPLDRHRA